MHVHLPLYAPHHFVLTSENGDFGACMADVDWSVKALLYELKRLGIYEDTLLIFTSDNGSRGDHGACNAPLRGTKFTVWEGGQRVPFVVHWKGHVREGAVVEQMASNIDLLPTFAAMLGMPLGGRKIDGVDVSRLLLGENTPVRTEFCYYQDQNLAAFRAGNWKLHRARKEEQVCELYDLDADLGETTDVSEKYPEIVARLEQRAQEYAAKLGDEIRGVKGGEIRPCLCVENPKTLTEYDENHPYIVALYDKGDVG